MEANRYALDDGTAARFDGGMSSSRYTPSLGRRLHRREGIGDTAHVVQQAPLLCRRLASPGPGAVLVLRGRKIMRRRGAAIAADAGQVVLIPDGIDFDVVNEPGLEGPYEAFALNFGSELVQGLTIQEGRAVQDILLLGNLPEGFGEACQRAGAAIAAGADLPDAVAAARVGEVLLWLAFAGYRFVPVAAPASTPARLRKALAADPARNWRAGDAAELLCMSEPSLRRRLAAAGTSFGQLLVDVRMTAALSLLQSTDRPVTTIALDVGYDSPSRFAARFRARFAFPPSAIRGRGGHFERNGTISDQPGAAPLAAE